MKTWVPNFTAPGAVTGRLTESKKSDTYTFKGKKGELWTISCDTGKISPNLDITISVIGPDGKELASKDDSSPSIDPELPITLPADGDYKIIVRDLSGKTKTPASVYRMVIDKTKTNFNLRTVPSASVPIGGTLALAITITREAGFKEPVTLTFANLPEGVSVPANLIILPTLASLNVTLTCTKDAPASAILAKITGTAKVGDQTITNTALAPLKGDLAARNLDSNLTEGILVATAIKPRSKSSP